MFRRDWGLEWDSELDSDLELDCSSELVTRQHYANACKDINKLILASE